MDKREQTAVQQFIQLPGISPDIGHRLYEMGFRDLEGLARADPKELASRGITRQLAYNIISISRSWEASGKKDLRETVEEWRRKRSTSSAVSVRTEKTGAKDEDDGFERELEKLNRTISKQLETLKKTTGRKRARRYTSARGKNGRGSGRERRYLGPASHNGKERERRRGDSVEWDEEEEGKKDEREHSHVKRHRKGPASAPVDKERLIRRRLNNTFDAITEADRRGLDTAKMWKAYNKAEYLINNGNDYDGAKLLQYCIRKVDLSIRKDELGIKKHVKDHQDNWDLTAPGRWELFKWWMMGKDRPVNLPEGYRNLDDPDRDPYIKKETPVIVWILRVSIPIAIGLGVSVFLLWLFGFL